MSIDSATAQMANTTLSEPTGTASGPSIGSGGDKPINASQNEAVIQSAAEGRRLYIGNLAYATTEGELKEFFNNYLVESVSIPVNPRTTRPVGYAFVDVSTPSEAERALTELNGKTILDRKVSVQLARKPDEPAPATDGVDGETRRRNSGRGRGRGRGTRGRGGRGGARGVNTTAVYEKDEANQEPIQGKTADGEVFATEETGPTNVPGQVEPLAQTTNEALTAEPGTNGTMDLPGKGQRAPRPRQRGPPENGIPSKTKVMVANLPYDITEEKLLEMFKDFEPTSAKLALRPIPRFMIRKLQARGEARKGRGFAFVTLGSEDLQQKAINEMNAKECDGREISVKIAIDTPGKEDDDVAEGKENGYPSTAEGSANASATVQSS